MKKLPFLSYGVGIDVSKANFHVKFMGKDSSETIKIRGGRTFDNTVSGIKKFLAWIEKHRKDKALPLRIYLEATGVYHERVLFHLYEAGYSVSLLMGKRVNAYKVSIGEDSKTDDKDSYALGHMALSRKERPWKPATAHILEVRSLMRLRRSLINSRVACQNQLHAITHSLYGSAQIPQVLTQTIDHLNDQIQTLEKEALELTQKDKELSEKAHMIVQSLKGIGLISFLEIVSEVNGFSQFRSINQLVKYAGLDIIEKQSGTVKGKTRISKKGNARIRSALYMPALSMIREKNQPLFSLYLRVVKRNPKIKKKAIVAVQRKLLILIFVLWKKNQPFDPKYQWNKQATAKKEVALA